MMHFVNDLLDYSMAKKGSMQKKICKFDPNETISSIVEMFGLEAEAKKVDLKHQVSHFLEPPIPNGERKHKLIIDSNHTARNRADTTLPCLQGDQVRLQQVLINLIKNSLKFTESGSIRVASSYNFIEQLLIV